jgi:hypothetical protein
MMEAGNTKTRFDMEQEIMQAWQVLDDIKMLSAREGTEKADWDAVGRLYQIRFETLFETFEQLIKDGAVL